MSKHVVADGEGWSRLRLGFCQVVLEKKSCSEKKIDVPRKKCVFLNIFLLGMMGEEDLPVVTMRTNNDHQLKVKF